MFIQSVNQLASKTANQSVGMAVSLSVIQSVSYSVSHSFIYYALSVLKILGLPYRKGLGPMESYYPSKLLLLHVKCNEQ